MAEVYRLVISADRPTMVVVGAGVMCRVVGRRPCLEQLILLVVLALLALLIGSILVALATPRGTERG